MAKHSKDFYSDFDAFLLDVTKDKSKMKKLSHSWLFAIGNVAGVSVLASIVQAIPTAVIGGGMSLGIIAGAGVTGTFGVVTIPVTAFAVTAYILMKKLSKKSSEADRSNDIKQLKKYKIAFQELQILKKSDPKTARLEIDNLFKDLVEGTKISL